MESKCLSCAKWSLRHEHDLRKHGFGTCELAEKWEFFAPTCCCPKHEPAGNDVVAKRKAYLERLR